MSSNATAVRNLLNSKVGLPVEKVIDLYDWKLDTDLVVNVLDGTPTEEQRLFIKSQLHNLSHHRDSRSAYEYGQELITNWLFEDIIALILCQDSELQITKTGKDSNRTFLSNPTADPDLTVTFQNTDYEIELVADYSGFWSRNGVIDLRDAKFDKILNTENSMLMGVDFESSETLIGIPEQMEVSYTESHPFWNKPAHRVTVESLQTGNLTNSSTVIKSCISNQ